MLTDKRLGWAVLVGMVIFGLWAYPQLPEIVPSHWNIHGEVDGYSSREVAVLLMPAITGFLLLVMWGYERSFGKTDWYARRPETYQTFTNVVILLLGLFYIAILGVAMGWPIELPRWFMIGFAVMFIILGNIMGRLEPNPYFGIRVPWTLNSRTVWRKTHRVFGRIWVAGGIVLLPLALLLPVQLLFAVAMPLILVCSLGAVAYAWWLARTEQA